MPNPAAMLLELGVPPLDFYMARRPPPQKRGTPQTSARSVLTRSSVASTRRSACLMNPVAWLFLMLLAALERCATSPRWVT